MHTCHIRTFFTSARLRVPAAAAAVMPTAYSPVSIETQKPRVPSQLLVKATGTALELSRQKRYRLKSVLMRSGTSRGLFLHRHDLPPSPSDWDSVLIGAMGSRNNDPRQLEGVGGATSTTSKVVVVAKSDRPGIDVEYTFAQVTVGQEKVDMTGNCGNMASGVAAFALEEGLVVAAPGQMEVITPLSVSDSYTIGSLVTDIYCCLGTDISQNI
jgi:hypothetical protein